MIILNGGNGASLRQPIQRVGVEAVLDAVQPVDQVRLAEGEAYP